MRSCGELRRGRRHSGRTESKRHLRTKRLPAGHGILPLKLRPVQRPILRPPIRCRPLANFQRIGRPHRIGFVASRPALTRLRRGALVAQGSRPESNQPVSPVSPPSTSVDRVPANHGYPRKSSRRVRTPTGGRMGSSRVVLQNGYHALHPAIHVRRDARRPPVLLLAQRPADGTRRHGGCSPLVNRLIVSANPIARSAVCGLAPVYSTASPSARQRNDRRRRDVHTILASLRRRVRSPEAASLSTRAVGNTSVSSPGSTLLDRGPGLTRDLAEIMSDHLRSPTAVCASRRKSPTPNSPPRQGLARATTPTVSSP